MTTIEKAREYYNSQMDIVFYPPDEQKLWQIMADFHEAQTRWISVEDDLPDELETVWLANLEKGWVWLGCRAGDFDNWWWAETNGLIYMDKETRKIVSECEDDDLDVTHWKVIMPLPEPPK